MSDFLIQFGAGLSAEAVAEAMRGREYMGDLAVENFDYPWGSIAIQQARCFGYRPYTSGGLTYFAAGRPRVVAVTHELDGPQGFTKRLAAWMEAFEADRQYENLTGIFAIGRCGPEGVILLTDRMGAFSVYAARDRKGQVRAVGSLAELVARAAGREGDFDRTSLAEIMLRYAPIFPYTTRRGMQELAPGSWHDFVPRGGSVEHVERCLWAPKEPDRYSSLASLREALVSALQTAGADLTRGAQRVAVTLSGGFDSRAVLAAVPPIKRAAALTFMDHGNYEFGVANLVARRAGVPHLPIQRDPDFYATIVPREAAFFGAEHQAQHAHGFALADAGMCSAYDLVLSGIYSDALLKGYFSPDSTRGYLLGMLGVPRAVRARCCVPRYDWTAPGRPTVMHAFRPAIEEALQERLAARLAEMEELRPDTAREWLTFYPFSRAMAGNYYATNLRLFPADELFLYRDIVEIGRITPLLPKLMDRLAVPAFSIVCGSLAEIENANTAIPANTGWWRTRVRLRLRNLGRWLRRKAPRRPYAQPWFAEESWVNFPLLQKHAPRWAELRSQAAASERGLDILTSILRIDPRKLLSGYDDSLNYQFQLSAVQLALYFAKPLTGAAPVRRPAVAVEPAPSGKQPSRAR
jgi:asparagine synthetase B (glutamine-hydrolysing)